MGIAGSVLTAYLTNRAAENRLRLEQDFEDSRRFHKERVELYGRVLALAQMCRTRILEGGIESEQDADKTIPENVWKIIMTAMADFTAAAKMVNLLGAPATRQAVATLIDAAHRLLGASIDTSDEEFDKSSVALRDAEQRSPMLPAPR